MSELEDKDIESLIEKLNETEKELAECLGEEEEEEEEEVIMVEVLIGQPLAEWNKRGRVRIKEDGEEKICYLRANKGKEKASVSRVVDFSNVNQLTFDYRHTYQTKAGQLKVYLGNKVVYDVVMKWGSFKGTIDTSEVKGAAELRFELVSRNPWYSTGNVNLYLSTMTGSPNEIAKVFPVFDTFEAKETAEPKPKMGMIAAVKIVIRNVGKERGKINVVFADLDKNKALATGSCTLNPMETIFPYVYYTESKVRLEKGGFWGYLFVYGGGRRHLGLKMWGEGEKEPEFEAEDTLQMKTWVVNDK